MLTSFEAVNDATEIVEGLCSKGADQATELVPSPTRTVLRLAPGSELYEAVPERMTRPKQARMWLTSTQRNASPFEGVEEGYNK